MARLCFINCFIDHLWSDHVSSCQLCCCHTFQVEDHSCELHHFVDFAFFCEVLLPKLRSIFQVLANFRIQFVIQSLPLIHWYVYNMHFFSRLTLNFCDRCFRFSESWSLFHCMFISLYHVDSPKNCICIIAQQVHRERCQSARCHRGIEQAHRSNPVLFGIFCNDNRFPNGPIYS